MAPLIYSSWWRRARTSVDNETPITLAGNISVATTTDGGSDSAPSASSPLDKPSGKEPSRMSGAKPAATHSVNAPSSTPEPHHSKEVNPSRISQTSINNVPEGTSTPTPPKEFTSETKISSSTSTETRSSEKSTTISTTSSSGTSTSGSTMSPRSSSSVAAYTSLKSSDVTTRTDGGGSESTTASTLITSPTVTETLANPGAIPPSAPLTPNTPNSTPNDDRDSSTIIILPSLNVATSTNQFIPTRTSWGDTVSPSSTPDHRVASAGTAQAENAPASLSTTLIIEVTSSEFRTTISSDHIITKDVTIFSTRTRTSVVSYPTSTVVGTTSTGTKSKTAALIGGIIGAAIIVLAISLLTWYLIRRRHRNEETRVLLDASSNPFPHSASPSLQAASPASLLGSPQMTTHIYPSTLAPQLTYSDTNPPEMVERLSDYPLNTSVTARKKPIPFMNNLDLNTETRLSIQPFSSLSMNLSSSQIHARPAAAEDPFADPDHNPFDDPRPTIPMVVVHPATPEPRNSDMSTLSGPKEYGVAV